MREQTFCIVITTSSVDEHKYKGNLGYLNVVVNILRGLKETVCEHVHWIHLSQYSDQRPREAGLTGLVSVCRYGLCSME
jgi:hypothetical protein